MKTRKSLMILNPNCFLHLEAPCLSQAISLQVLKPYLYTGDRWLASTSEIPQVPLLRTFEGRGFSWVSKTFVDLSVGMRNELRVKRRRWSHWWLSLSLPGIWMVGDDWLVDAIHSWTSLKVSKGHLYLRVMNWIWVLKRKKIIDTYAHITKKT